MAWWLPCHHRHGESRSKCWRMTGSCGAVCNCWTSPLQNRPAQTTAHFNNLSLMASGWGNKNTCEVESLKDTLPLRSASTHPLKSGATAGCARPTLSHRMRLNLRGPLGHGSPRYLCSAPWPGRVQAACTTGASCAPVPAGLSPDQLHRAPSWQVSVCEAVVLFFAGSQSLTGTSLNVRWRSQVLLKVCALWAFFSFYSISVNLVQHWAEQRILLSTSKQLISNAKKPTRPCDLFMYNTMGETPHLLQLARLLKT